MDFKLVDRFSFLHQFYTGDMLSNSQMTVLYK